MAAATSGAAAVGLAGPGSPKATAAAPMGTSLLDAIQKRGSLRVGMTLQFPPEMYRDDKTREPKGYDVELVKLMADDLKVKLDIQDQDFPGLIPALLAGKVDILSVGLVGRPERAKTMWFSDPYVPYQQVIMIQSKSPVTDFAQLDHAGARITALTGSTAADLAKRLFPKATVVELDQQPAMLEVASGRADGCVVEAYLAIPFIKQNPTAKILHPERPFALEFGAYGLPRGDVDWWMWVNSWLRYWKGKGVPQKLYDDIVGPTLGGAPVYKDIPRY
jgi:ABC-type amino acid transport substrate-binding protein